MPHCPTPRPRPSVQRIPALHRLILGLAGIIIVAAPPARSADGDFVNWFTSSGSTRQALYQPGAAMLGDGRVLMLGGSLLQPQGGSPAAIASCELFDPASGTWATTGSMLTARRKCATCLLPDGRLMVAGGFDVSGGVTRAIATAEMFDPAAGSWSPLPAMPAGLIDATLIALPGGQILALGTTAAGPSAGAVYSSASGAWRAIAPTIVPRNACAYALLPSGLVLAAGGYVLNGPPGSFTASPTTSCELYDAMADAWSPTGYLLGNHLSCQCVVLPSGAVLIGGGSGGSGAQGNTGAADSELYADGSWTQTGQLPYRVIDAAVCLLSSGDVLSAGGTSGRWVTSAARYSCATGTWSAAFTMADSHYFGALAALPGDRAVVLDGWDEIPGADGSETFASDGGSEVYQGLLINSAPSFTAGADQAVFEGSGQHTVVAWATAISPGTPAESAQTVTFQVAAANPGLFSIPPAVDAAGTLTYTLAADAVGATTVAVQAHDDGGTADGGHDTSAAQSFTITIAAVNQPPQWTPGPAVTVAEDSPPYSAVGWATGISPGPADQSRQTVGFALSCSVPDLFSAAPAISPDGTLTFTPASGRYGQAQLTAILSNSGGTANGGSDAAPPVAFIITVTQRIEPPSARTLTLHSVLGITVSGQILLSDPDHQLPPGTPSFTLTGISQLGPLTVTAAGLVTFTPLQAGSQQIPYLATVAGASYPGIIQLYANALVVGRPLIASTPSREEGTAGSPWSYDLVVDPLSIAAGDALTVSVLSGDAALTAAAITPASGNQFLVFVPALDGGSGTLQSLTLIVTDQTTNLSEFQTVFLVVLPAGGST